MKKSGKEIMEILEAFDLTRCCWSAAVLAGCDPKTVGRYVTVRDRGGDPYASGRRERITDPHLEKIEEWVERSRGRIRADVVYRRLQGMGYGGSERTIRRVVAEAKAAWRAGRSRPYRPWVTEPGMWLQWDWGEGPVVGMGGDARRTLLFCAWLAWSRFRVVIPTWDRTLPTLLACLDAALRELGGAPTYLLTDNERTVTVDRVAGVPVRHPEMVAVGRHYGCGVETCAPADAESKGGVEATVRIAKADLVPTRANLLPAYGSFAELEVACFEFCRRVNARPHRETGQPPVELLPEERSHLHPLPPEPYLAALGETRLVNSDQTIRFGSVRYSTPPGHVGETVWCRVQGNELVVVARTPNGLREIARHRLSTPGRPQILDEHYPSHRPAGPRRPEPEGRTEAEGEFLTLGDGASQWLCEAAASGAQRVRSIMARAVELAKVVGAESVDRALGAAGVAGRFKEADLVSILDHLTSGAETEKLVRADEEHSTQPGTAVWKGFGE